MACRPSMCPTYTNLTLISDRLCGSNALAFVSAHHDNVRQTAERHNRSASLPLQVRLCSSFCHTIKMVDLTRSIPVAPVAEMNDFVLGLTVGRLALDLAVRLGTHVEKRYHHLVLCRFFLMQNCQPCSPILRGNGCVVR